MPPKPGPAVPAASRRAKRIIESASPSPSPEMELEPELELEADEVDDEEDELPDADYESEEDPLAFRSAVAEEMELDPQPGPGPASALRIRLKVNNDTESGRPSRAAPKRSGKRTKRVALEVAMGSDEEEPLDDGPDELDVLSYAGSSRRSISPSKLTARQRAKGNKDLQDTLIALPNGALPPHPFHWARLMGEVDTQGKKLVLTEAERLQRREETARRRKRQSEQRLQDEQDQTINRLLRAQTGRSRSKLDGPSPGPASAGESRVVSPTRRPGPNSRLAGTGVKDGMIRWVSSISGDNVSLRVGVPVGKEEWIAVGGQSKEGKGVKRDTSGVCAVEGCGERRKYRSIGRFEVGGCCLQHLKAVEAGLRG